MRRTRVLLRNTGRGATCRTRNGWPRRLVWTAALLIGLLGFWTRVVDAEPGQDSYTILLSNDDGIEAKGLEILHDALQSVATVIVVAPANDRSGSGHSVTIRDSIRVEPRRGPEGSTWYAVHATPATTVRLGLKALLDQTPDLFVSGINHGRNVGVMTWTSGTVGAAREAALSGIPAIAVSQSGEDLGDYKALAAYVARLIEVLRTGPFLHPGFLLNVNGPPGLGTAFKGVRVVPLGPQETPSSFERLSTGASLSFREIWHPPKPENKGGDVSAHTQGYITVTPLALDQTDRAALDPLAAVLDTDADSASTIP